MNAKKLVKATNIVGMVAVTLLVYWVFALILIQVFGLKVFREHITEIFLMSILGIFAVMGGTLMLNIMLNLTRIAERGQEGRKQRRPENLIFVVGSIPFVGGIVVRWQLPDNSTKTRHLNPIVGAYRQRQSCSNRCIG